MLQEDCTLVFEGFLDLDRATRIGEAATSQSSGLIATFEDPSVLQSLGPRLGGGPIWGGRQTIATVP